jgi:hypothetical protein
VIGRRATPADFRGFSSPADRFNFQPFNFLQIPLERVGVFGNLKYELTDSINFSVRTLYNQRKSKNQAAPLPFGFGPTSGLTPVLSNIVVSATNPFNPFGVDLGGSNGNVGAVFRRFLEGGPRRFNQTVDTYYGVATLDGDSRSASGAGSGTSMPPTAATRPSSACSATSTRACCARRSVRSPAAQVLACRSICLAGSDRSRPRCSTS